MDPRIKIYTPLREDPAGGGIDLVQIQGIESAKLSEFLWEKDRVATIAIKYDQFKGIRVTRNVYTTLDEVDTFIDGMRRAPKTECNHYTVMNFGASGCDADNPHESSAGCWRMVLKTRDAGRPERAEASRFRAHFIQFPSDLDLLSRQIRG